MKIDLPKSAEQVIHKVNTFFLYRFFISFFAVFTAFFLLYIIKPKMSIVYFPFLHFFCGKLAYKFVIKKNRSFILRFSVSINLSARWHTLKKKGKSVRRALAGVQRYVRGRAGRKQAKVPKFRGLEIDSIKYLI